MPEEFLLTDKELDELALQARSGQRLTNIAAEAEFLAVVDWLEGPCKEHYPSPRIPRLRMNCQECLWILRSKVTELREKHLKK